MDHQIDCMYRHNLALGLLLFLMFLLAPIKGQDVTTFDLKQGSSDVLYINVQPNNEVLYFVDDIDNRIDDKKPFDGTNNGINIYVKWMNPLRRKLVWKDSTMVDQRDVVVSDFVKQIAATFSLSEGFPLDAESTGFLNSEENTTSEEIKSLLFADEGLLLMMIHLRSNENRLDSVSISQLNSFLVSLKALDHKIHTTDVDKIAAQIFTKLYSYESIDSYLEGRKQQLTEFDNLKVTANNIKVASTAVSAISTNIIINDDLIKAYVKVVISAYISSVNKYLNHVQNLTNTIEPLFKILDNSTLSRSQKHPDYVLSNKIRFPDSKIVTSKFDVTQNELRTDPLRLTPTESTVSSNLEFRKFNRIRTYVSAGVFYGNATLRHYGVSQQDNEFFIEEQEITKGSPITASFLNFTISGDRYLVPLLQLGIDPTKNRPFLLAGTGFAIPAARFSISGGFIWTWDQTLNKLSVGEKVADTASLMADINYNFEINPQGWYIGIQYDLSNQK